MKCSDFVEPCPGSVYCLMNSCVVVRLFASIQSFIENVLSELCTIAIRIETFLVFTVSLET
jgi:hypothetical protein